MECHTSCEQAPGTDSQLRAPLLVTLCVCLQLTLPAFPTPDAKEMTLQHHLLVPAPWPGPGSWALLFK